MSSLNTDVGTGDPAVKNTDEILSAQGIDILMLERKDIFKNMVVTEGLKEAILEQDPEGEEGGVS